MTTSTSTECRKNFFERLTDVTPQDRELVETAYDFGKYAHRTQTRKTGERYFEHPRAVALILIDELKITDARIISAALLHDVLEDTHLLTKTRIKKLFGNEVSSWADVLTKQDGIPYYPRLLQAPWQAVLIKFGDRLHNLRMMNVSLGEEWVQKYLKETRKEYPSLGKYLLKVAPKKIREGAQFIMNLLNTEVDRITTDLDTVRKNELARNNAIKEGLHYVILGQQWFEYESDWGSKPYDFTGHLSEGDRNSYIQQSDKQQSKNTSWHTYPVGESFKCLVTHAEYMLIKTSKNGMNIGDRSPRTVDDSFSVGDSIALKALKK